MAFTVVGAGHVGDEREEVVGLAIQAEGVEPPQRERRVAHPGVAVVPVAFALRGFRQRRGRRRQQRTGRRVRQPLQRQRAALQIGPPRVVGEVADVDPLPPALAGLPHSVGGLVIGLRHRMFRPAQRDEDVVAFLHPGAGPRLAALQPDAQVGGQPHRRMRVGILVGPRDRLAVGLGRVLPAGADAVVVERRLAAHHQLDGAAHTPHRAQQDVLGIPVHRRAAVGARPRLDVVPGPHHQRVADDDPAGVGLPGGLQDQAARQVAARRGHRYAVGPEPEVSGAAIQDGPEHARASPAWARTATPPNRRTRSGRCSHSRRGTRSRRSAGTGSATIRSARTAPGPSRSTARARGLVGLFILLQNHADIIDSQPARRPLVGGCVRRCWLGLRCHARACGHRRRLSGIA